jgi:hypothetical protein
MKQYRLRASMPPGSSGIPEVRYRHCIEATPMKTLLITTAIRTRTLN